MKGGKIIKGEGFRILDIDWGFTKDEMDDSFELSTGTLPRVNSFSDFDAIFFDPIGFSSLWSGYLKASEDGVFRTSPEEDGGLSRGLINLMETRKEEAKNFLASGGIFFCKLRKFGRPLKIITGEAERTIHRYSWLPDLEIETIISEESVTPRSGSRMFTAENSSPLTTYIDSYRGLLRYEATVDRKTIRENPSINPLAYTPTDEVISFSWSGSEGSMVFLPAGGNLNSNAKKGLIDTVREVTLSPPYSQPDWLDTYRFEEENELESELEKLREEISRLENKQEKKLENLHDFKVFKGILSASTDYQLRSSLISALQRVGLGPVDNPTSSDLILINQEGADFAISVGAEPETSVGLTPYHDLVKGINELTIYEEIDPQGVIIVNGQSSLKPEEREEGISQELKEGSNLYGFTVLRSYDVFKRISQAKDEGTSVKKGLIELFQNG